MKRIDFIKSISTVVIGVPFISSLSGCSSDSDPVPETVDCLTNGTGINIGANHGHSLTVSRFDVEAGTEQTYSIQGTSAHNHVVTLTQADFTSLKSNQSINVLSDDSGSGHTHTVNVQCA